MPQTCTVCRRDDRDEINAALLRGEPTRSIAARTSLSHAALGRHKRTCLAKDHAKALAQVAPAVVAHVEAESERPAGVRELLTTMVVRLLRQADDALAKQDPSEERAALREITRVLGVAVRAEAELGGADAASRPLHHHREWVGVRVALEAALAEYPEARDAVVRVLADHTEAA